MWDKLSAEVVRHAQNDAASKIQAHYRRSLGETLVESVESFFAPHRWGRRAWQRREPTPGLWDPLGQRGYCYSKNTTTLMVTFPGYDFSIRNQCGPCVYITVVPIYIQSMTPENLQGYVPPALLSIENLKLMNF